MLLLALTNDAIAPLRASARPSSPPCCAWRRCVCASAQPSLQLRFGWRHALAARHGLEVEPVPILFAALLDANGQKGPAEIPAKRAYLFREVVRIAHRLGLKSANGGSSKETVVRIDRLQFRPTVGTLAIRRRGYDQSVQRLPFPTAPHKLVGEVVERHTDGSRQAKRVIQAGARFALKDSRDLRIADFG